MRDALIGIVTAIAAVAAWAWLRPAPVAAGFGPAVWQVSTSDVASSSVVGDRPRAAATTGATTRPSAGKGASPGLPHPPPRLQAVLESRKLARVHFDKAPLADVIKFFAGELGMNFWVNWRALAAAGIEPSVPISLQLGEVTAARDRPDHVEVTEALSTLIQECVDPTSWRDAGGSVGSVISFAGLLIVTQTPESLREVERLLAQLRERLAE